MCVCVAVTVTVCSAVPFSASGGEWLAQFKKNADLSFSTSVAGRNHLNNVSMVIGPWPQGFLLLNPCTKVAHNLLWHEPGDSAL